MYIYIFPWSIEFHDGIATTLGIVSTNQFRIAVKLLLSRADLDAINKYLSV